MGGTASGEKYRPPFPMNLMQNQKVFWLVGGVVMIGGILVAAIFQSNNASRAAVPTVVPTATVAASGTPDPNATPSPTPVVKKFTQAEQVVDATAKSYTATIKTDKGDIEMQLFADKSPRTVNTFVFLAKNLYFDGIVFHRVVPQFVVQGGDPTGTGSGGPGFDTEEDQNDLKNVRSYVSMAKAGAVTTFGSQFFINLKDNPALDADGPSQKRFYPWAQVTKGMDVVDKLAQGDVIRSVTINEVAK